MSRYVYVNISSYFCRLYDKIWINMQGLCLLLLSITVHICQYLCISVNICTYGSISEHISVYLTTLKCLPPAFAGTRGSHGLPTSRMWESSNCPAGGSAGPHTPPLLLRARQSNHCRTLTSAARAFHWQPSRASSLA